MNSWFTKAFINYVRVIHRHSYKYLPLCQLGKHSNAERCVVPFLQWRTFIRAKVAENKILHFSDQTDITSLFLQRNLDPHQRFRDSENPPGPVVNSVLICPWLVSGIVWVFGTGQQRYQIQVHMADSSCKVGCWQIEFLAPNLSWSWQSLKFSTPKRQTYDYAIKLFTFERTPNSLEAIQVRLFLTNKSGVLIGV